MTESIQQQKSQIRAHIRRLRRNISQTAASEAGFALAKWLHQLPQYPSAKHIACFWSFDGEIDTAPVINQLLKDKGRCYLPKLRPTKPNRLWFMPYTQGQTLDKNKLGIPEVDLPVNHAIAVSDIDILFMPLVAFDQMGNRLGMGGGYYDATLAPIKSAGPLCIGLAFEAQKVATIPIEPWDFPLAGVLTEKSFYDFR